LTNLDSEDAFVGLGGHANTKMKGIAGFDRVGSGMVRLIMVHSKGLYQVLMRRVTYEEEKAQNN
jgi:hypothetical protein